MSINYEVYTVTPSTVPPNAISVNAPINRQQTVKSLAQALSTRPLYALPLLLGLLLSCYNSHAYASAWNNPYPESEKHDNILYSAFAERPKHLDPVRSYSENEYTFLGNIYEPPLQYHYLHRPYRLEPQTLTRMPEIAFLDHNGYELFEPFEPEQIGFTEYRFELQQGILYQPHPAFAKSKDGDQQNQYTYHHLSDAEIEQFKTMADFTQTDTRELIAQDYVNQIKRMSHPQLHSPIRGLMQKYILGMAELSQQLKQKIDNKDPIDLRDHALEGAYATDNYHFTIRLKGQYPQFTYWLAMPFFAPIPWEADQFYQQAGLKKNNISLDWYPIGTGAYMLTENNPNLRMVLEKNPNFRKQLYPFSGEESDTKNGLLKDSGKQIPFIEKVVFSLEKESIPYWNKFLQGYFDRSGISSDSFDNAVSFGDTGDINLTDEMQAKGVKLNTVVNTSSFYLGFNMLDPTVGGDSERARLLRQAIGIAIDYEEFISIFRNGRGIPGQSPIPPGIFGYKQGEAGINPYSYDWVDGKPQRKSLDQAKQLLEQAGYKNGVDQKTQKPLTLYYEAVGGGPGSKAVLNWYRKQFDKLNIQLIIRATDYNRFQEKMDSGKAQLYALGWNADYPDPENFLFLLYGPQGKVMHKGENGSNYANAEYDRLFDLMKNLPNSSKRQAVIDQMLEILRHDAPWVFSFHPKTFSLQHSWYHNTKPFVMTNTGTLKYLRIDTQERQLKRDAWNTPIIWPVAIIILFIVGLVVPAVLAYRRHERKRVL